MVKESAGSKVGPLKLIKKADRLENSAEKGKSGPVKAIKSPKFIINANSVEILLSTDWSIKVSGLDSVDKLDLQTLQEVCIVAIEQKIIPYNANGQNGKKVKKAVEAAFRTVVTVILDYDKLVLDYDRFVRGVVAKDGSKKQKQRV